MNRHTYSLFAMVTLLVMVLLSTAHSQSAPPLRVYLYNGNSQGVQTYTVIVGLEDEQTHRGVTDRMVLPEAEMYMDLARPTHDNALIWLDAMPNPTITQASMDVPPDTSAPNHLCSQQISNMQNVTNVNIVVSNNPDSAPTCSIYLVSE